jgi:ribosomal protein S18
MDEFHYLDVLAMRRFMSDDSEILPKRITGLCSRCQRKVSKF